MRAAKLIIFCVIVASFTFLKAETPEEAFIYISPVPNSELNLKETTILLRTGGYFNQTDYEALSQIAIEGGQSGMHDFVVIPSDDNFTAIIQPTEYFQPSESVTVYFDSTLLGGYIVDGSFSFAVSPQTDRISAKQIKNHIECKLARESDFTNHTPVDEDLILDDDGTLPADFPERALLHNDNPDSGYVFVCNNGVDAGMPYIMILDNNAYPIFYKHVYDEALDFKKQPSGYLTYIIRDRLFFMVMDSTYTVIDSFSVQNGYETDEHDFQMLENGHVLIAAYDGQVFDMSQIVPGGRPDAIVIGYVIQEQDSNKNVVFQWRTWDFLEITEATNVTFTGYVIDYAHGNSLELDNDGHLLVSFRNMESLTKINRQTGEIIWRLGGVNNQFTIMNDSLGWSRQHDLRRLDNGQITIYDNAMLEPYPYNISHASQYELNEINMTCTLVWEYVNSPAVRGPTMGNAQRLPNGNTMICWGGHAPITVTEARMDSAKAWEMTFSIYENHRVYSYRAFRFPWHGVAAVPYLTAEYPDSAIHLIFNKFGDQTVEKYYIYAGQTPEPTAVIDSTSSNSIDLTEIPNGMTYFRVTALDSLGNESGFSNEESLYVHLFPDTKEYLPADMNMLLGQWPPQVIGSDVTYLVNYFRRLQEACLLGGFFCPADVNGDCRAVGSDVTRLVGYFRGTADIAWCPEYPPAWPTPDDLPVEVPTGWPGCE